MIFVAAWCVNLGLLLRLLEGWAFVLSFRRRAPSNVLARAQTRSAYLSFQLGEVTRTLRAVHYYFTP